MFFHKKPSKIQKYIEYTAVVAVIIVKVDMHVFV